MGAQGDTTINFGAFPGNNEATATVTSQGSIVAGSDCEAYFMREASSSYTAIDHMFAALFISFTCGNIQDGVGFTIYGVSLEKMQGVYTVHWVWN